MAPLCAGGGVLTGTEDKTTTIATVDTNDFIINEDTELGVVWNVLPCWHRGKFGLGKNLGLRQDGFRKAMATFTSARWCDLEFRRGVRETAELGYRAWVCSIVGEPVSPLVF